MRIPARLRCGRRCATVPLKGDLLWSGEESEKRGYLARIISPFLARSCPFLSHSESKLYQLLQPHFNSRFDSRSRPGALPVRGLFTLTVFPSADYTGQHPLPLRKGSPLPTPNLCLEAESFHPIGVDLNAVMKRAMPGLLQLTLTLGTGGE